MFSIKKFGVYLSSLRKKADMTQSELADKLNLTRQAISKYECGDSFPEITTLITIAKIFDITLDSLIFSGNPTEMEALLLSGKSDAIENIPDIMNIAPLLKPSILDKIAENLSGQGISISNIIVLSEYLNSKSLAKLLENAVYNIDNEELLRKLIPFLNNQSKMNILEKILSGELHYSFIKELLPYMENYVPQIEQAILYGALNGEVLKILWEYRIRNSE